MRPCLSRFAELDFFERLEFDDFDLVE